MYFYISLFLSFVIFNVNILNVKLWHDIIQMYKLVITLMSFGVIGGYQNVR